MQISLRKCLHLRRIREKKSSSFKKLFFLSREMLLIQKKMLHFHIQNFQSRNGFLNLKHWKSKISESKILGIFSRGNFSPHKKP